MPFANPTTPNLGDYLVFLLGVVGIPSAQFASASGTATAGSTTTLTDTTQTWTVNQWAGYAVQDTTQGAVTYVASNTANTLTLSPALTLPVTTGDGYLVLPAIAAETFSVAMDITNDALSQAAGSQYSLAVYNLGADRLINYATDIAGQTFFTDLRKELKITTLSVGVASSANDQGTSVGILNPEAMRMFTMMDLQTLKTPYGRTYMGIAQQYGPSIWGVT